MQKKELIYEGKGKKMFATDDANLLIAEFKDDLTAFDAQKRGNEAGKGALNNKISTQLFHFKRKRHPDSPGRNSKRHRATREKMRNHPA